jgi:hypothetical protein
LTDAIDARSIDAIRVVDEIAANPAIARRDRRDRRG